MNWYININCKGIVDGCSTYVRIGGCYRDQAEPNFNLPNGKEFSWLYIVECQAKRGQNAAASWVSRDAQLLVPPSILCADAHEQAKKDHNDPFLTYSKARIGDHQQVRKQAPAAARFSSSGAVATATNAIHDPRLTLGSAMYHQVKAQAVSRTVKADKYGVDGRSAAAVITELQERHQDQCDTWVSDHMTKKQVCIIMSICKLLIILTFT